jgi:Tfp pilus assembly protein PilP
MDYKNALRNLITAVAILGAIAVASVMTRAQDKPESKKSTVQRTSGRDPFRKYEPVFKTKSALSKLEPPSIQARIDRYRAQKMAAATAHVAPPKPTTALLLSEMQVTGIFRTPRGWAALVEATPIKLSYVIYPGETFFDGQLVAIEETRLVFRRDTVWGDGRREKSIEIKPLRQPNPVEAMTSSKSHTNSPAPESEKPAVPEKQ